VLLGGVRPHFVVEDEDVDEADQGEAQGQELAREKKKTKVAGRKGRCRWTPSRSSVNGKGLLCGCDRQWQSVAA
jgi:hypothetical protein